MMGGRRGWREIFDEWYQIDGKLLKATGKSESP